MPFSAILWHVIVVPAGAEVKERESEWRREKEEGREGEQRVIEPTSWR